MSTSLVDRMEEAILWPARKAKVLPAPAFPGSMALLVAGEPTLPSVGQGAPFITNIAPGTPSPSWP
jgi:hypothetical protein